MTENIRHTTTKNKTKENMCPGLVSSVEPCKMLFYERITQKITLQGRLIKIILRQSILHTKPVYKHRIC